MEDNQYKKPNIKKILTYVAFFLLGACTMLLLFIGVQPRLLTSLQGTYQINTAARLIQEYYYKPSDSTELYTAAAKGMVDSLDDPYAAFYTKEEYKQITQTHSGKYEGIGISFSFKDGKFIAVQVYPNSPAERAGVQSGDQIFAVNGIDLPSTDFEGGTALLQTQIQENSQVTLTIQHGDEQKDVVITVEEVQLERVVFEMLEDDIAYIRISEFYGDASKEFKQAVEQAKAQNAKSIILDLRNNPGGSLDVVNDIANYMLDDGVLLTMRTRSGKEETHTTKANNDYTTLPLVVLMNENSASASEVLAGAIQDRNRGIVIGTQSYGKGIVQTIIPIWIDGSHLKMTTSTYYTPNGRAIHEIGITPDIEIELAEKWQNKVIDLVPQDQDAQLQEAITYSKANRG